MSSTCSSCDDVQKLWRFANIIENSKEKQINGIQHEKLNEDIFPEDGLNFEQSNSHYQQSKPHCRHRRGQYVENKQTCDEEAIDEQSSESDESTTRHSQGCEFHETPSEKDISETNYGKLESTVYQMNKKLQILEKKMDKILDLVEQKETSKKS
jgi:hypothetical protein